MKSYKRIGYRFDKLQSIPNLSIGLVWLQFLSVIIDFILSSISIYGFLCSPVVCVIHTRYTDTYIPPHNCSKNIDIEINNFISRHLASKNNEQTVDPSLDSCYSWTVPMQKNCKNHHHESCYHGYKYKWYMHSKIPKTQ